MKKTAIDFKTLKAELDEVLISLQDETTDIDEALKNYQRGLELTKLLEDYLQQAENQITELKTTKT